MPYILKDLEINRVDLVDEGANSAAFIELFKRKENTNAMDYKEILSKMKPEHAEAIEAEITKANESLTVANEALAKANEELETLKANPNCTCDGEVDAEGMCAVCGKPKNVVTKKICATCGADVTGDVCEDCAAKEAEAKAAAFDETETMKSMPEAARAIFEKMKAQKDVAEEELRKSKEAEAHSVAVAKAANLKALPIETGALVELIKSASPEMVDALDSISKAIEGTVLNEVGKSNQSNNETDSWAKIEAKAEEIAKRDNITKQKAVGVAIKENSELYKEYLEGGAN